MPVDSEDSEMLRLRAAIQSIADKKDFRMDENDVDFNFENVERKELYVHMACSRLRNVQISEEDWRLSGCAQIVEFIIAVLIDLREKDLLQKLFDQMDAQGRTILQVFVLWKNSQCTNTFEEMLQILPEACVNTPDKAGRTVLHWAVAHDNTSAFGVLLASEKASSDVTFTTAYITDITAFHSILLYDNDMSHFFNLEAELIRNFCCFSFVDTSILAFRQGTLNFHPENLLHEGNALLWAIRMGRNRFVKHVMVTQVICPHLCTSLTLTLICSIV
jgi:ankyrin repeat protein